MRKQLAAWNLKMAVHDGIAAGATKTVAWVAANVDASIGKVKAPYRVLALYERAGTDWKLVQLHFSTEYRFEKRPL